MLRKQKYKKIKLKTKTDVTDKNRKRMFNAESRKSTFHTKIDENYM